MAESMGRMISLNLRTPSPLSQREKVEQLVDQLRGIAGSRSYGFGVNKVLSLPDAIGQVLSEYVGDEPETIQLTVANGNGSLDLLPLNNGAAVLAVGDLCPRCGVASYVREEGCKKCHSCGYSEC